jgi:oligoribonuclease (3'-5' exoribonuclease)
MKIFWTDIEATGLDSSKDKILEIVLGISDFYNPCETSIIYESVISFKQNEYHLMDDIVLKMHTNNNLLTECLLSDKTIEDVEREILDVIPRPEKGQKHIMAGSSVWFDKNFYTKNLPKVDALFIHRLYDVSTLKMECEMLGMPKIPKGEAHRAKADIFESIEHLKLLRQWKQEYYKNI